MSIANHLASNDPSITTIVFYTDSSSAITNISRTHTHPSQQLSILFSARATEFLESNHNNWIHISWVPSHKDIEINELADKAAKRGCRLEHTTQVSLSYYKEKATKMVLKGWRKEFNEKLSTLPLATLPSSHRTRNPAEPSNFSRMTQKFLVASPNYEPCTDTIHIIITGSISLTETGTASVVTPLHPQQPQWENTSFTFAPSYRTNEANSSLPSPDSTTQESCLALKRALQPQLLSSRIPELSWATTDHLPLPTCRLFHLK